MTPVEPLPERLADWIATHPGGPVGHIVALRHGVPRPGDPRPVVRAPDTPTRVLIAPLNHAGQAEQWARSLEASDARIGARTLAVRTAFDYPAGAVVEPRVFQNSSSWQRAQRDAAQGFTHLLVESARPPFGRLHGRSLTRQLSDLGPHISTAVVCHGTDVRRLTAPRSGGVRLAFDPGDALVRRATRAAERTIAQIRELRKPVFVSTPDLLDDLPEARWLPVVVDPAQWEGPAASADDARVRVVHAPSASLVKGTALVDPILRGLDAEGVIAYRAVTGVPHDAMPSVLADADIVIDQFRVGSYGVAACEAMAAGRVVVGHVYPAVRERVRAATGLDLPVIESTPDTLDHVLRTLAADPGERRRLGAAGCDFVATVHSGAYSAAVLREWLVHPAGTVA
ncbi:glycosyltransferase family 1 protein [Microbacterium sp. dk485]|uniref:glycosyltransferase family 1 protein n=1 Tax=Microbacterium sp. dk485 TaxID=2560021 RepID=UPI001073F7C9|nr:glycosyltransferase family 1 protein [Microbacterium sp. dk485]TFV83797.1 glycosyltransferase family 1 protein [Microbacterium sp. dk485]